MACLNKDRPLPFPIKALDDCMYGGFVYLQNLNFFFLSEMWGPLKYQPRLVGLATVQLHVMSRNVPQAFPLQVNIVCLFSRPPNRLSSITNLLTERNHSHDGKAGISISFYYFSAPLLQS